jgi:hypothetical protein
MIDPVTVSLSIVAGILLVVWWVIEGDDDNDSFS